MIGRILCLFLVGALAVSTAALAQDEDDFSTDDEFIFEDGGDEPPADEDEEADGEEDKDDDGGEDDRAEPPPPPPDEDFDFEDEVDDEGNLLEDDLFEDDEELGGEEILPPGTDTEPIYRAQVAQMEGLAADEEVLAWELYLEEYPNSVFRDLIQQRVDALMKEQFSRRIRRDDPSGKAPRDAEILMVTPSRMVPLNPRTQARVHLQFGFGVGTFVGGVLDFEYALLRNVSVHGGFTGRLDGWGLEFGSRYAFVKSTKDQLVASLIGDFRVNFQRLGFQARPQIGFGKIVGPAQILATVGAQFGSRAYEPVQVIGGVHVGVRVAKPVGIFVESEFAVSNLTRPQGVFAFATVALGLKFYPPIKNQPMDVLELGANGRMPVATKYVQPYLGAGEIQGAWFFETPYVR